MRYIALIMEETHKKEDVIKTHTKFYLTSEECERWAQAIIKASEFAETHDVEKINKIACKNQMNSEFDIDLEAKNHKK